MYDLRSRLIDDLADFERDEVKSSINTELDSTENWLYEEGEECLKHVYVDRLAELKVGGAAAPGAGACCACVLRGRWLSRFVELRRGSCLVYLHGEHYCTVRF